MATWLVESYWPAAAGAPEVAAARLRASSPQDVRLIGVVHVPVDEMALWRLEAVHEEAARAACRAADIAFERIVEVMDIREAEWAAGS